MSRRGLPSRLVLLGHPVRHSLSPRFQTAALRAAGLSLEYSALDVLPGELPQVLEALRLEDAAGNVTMPHKRAVAVACTHVTPVAARVGAVNTFWFDGGALCGDNTDVGGFTRAAETLLGLPSTGEWPRRIALLGAGGAARAVLAAVEARGEAAVDLHVRTPANGELLAREFTGVQLQSGPVARDVSLVVNATSVGMAGEALPLPVDQVPPGAAVLDLVYRQGETPWVKACRAAGHPAADGMEMLLAQGALAFERLTGMTANVQVMRKSLLHG